MPSYVRGSDNFDSLASVKPSLLAEYTVTGSACTSIDFSGLDINTHKSYRVEMELINATATLFNVYSFINNDTTLTNYYTQTFEGQGPSIVGGRVNSPLISSVTASAMSSSNSTITKSNGYPEITNNLTYDLGSSVKRVVAGIIKTSTVTNITQLTFTSSIASAIGIGSTIRIYRGDV